MWPTIESGRFDSAVFNTADRRIAIRESQKMAAKDAMARIFFRGRIGTARRALFGLIPAQLGKNALNRPMSLVSDCMLELVNLRKRQSGAEPQKS